MLELIFQIGNSAPIILMSKVISHMNIFPFIEYNHTICIKIRTSLLLNQPMYVIILTMILYGTI